jgi:6-phosphogluconolactonase
MPPERDAGADTGEAGDSAAMMPDGTAPPPGTDGGDATTSLGPLVAYASGYGPDIDVYAVDAASGALSLGSSVTAFGTSPSFLAIDRAVAHLYAVDENTTGRVGAYAIDPTTGALTFLDAVSSGGAGPPFVALDRSEAFVLVANYGDGTVSVLPVQAGGTLGAAKSTLTVGTNPHMIITDLSNKFAFVPCLGSGYVAQFLFDATTGALTPNAIPYLMTATGAGPRHLAFHPDGKLAYLINETNSTLTAYSLDGAAGTLTEIQTVSTIQSGFTGTNTAAEVWVHPSGAWVLGSNRGDDSLVVFAIDQTTGRMTPAGSTKSGGTTPRDFTIDPTGTLVYAANQGTGNVVPFAFDITHGTLTPTGTAVSVPAASFVGVVRLP